MHCRFLYRATVVLFLFVSASQSQAAEKIPGIGGTANKTLYVTARTSLYSVEMEVTGHVFPAGGK